MRRPLTTLILGAALTTLLLTGCAEESPVSAPTTTTPTTTTVAPAADTAVSPQIDVAQFQFQPGDLTVAAGTTVMWVNSDRIVHTVTAGAPDAASGLFDIDLDGAGSVAEFQFDEPGVYDYFCNRHPHMVGTITVIGS